MTEGPRDFRGADPAESILLVETYLSIQGESTFAGLPCWFIRTARCNLRCSWCDSSFTFSGGTRRPVDEVVAEALGARDLFIGVNSVDFSGYPDCRPEFLEAFEALAKVATKAGVEGDPFRIHAPLLRMTKADIVRRGVELGVDLGLTRSCYDLDHWGRACGHCDSCHLRRKGFEGAGVADPTEYQQ